MSEAADESTDIHTHIQSGANDPATARRGGAVGAVAGMFKVPEPAASPAAHWIQAGRLAAAATLVLGAAFQLASFLLEPENLSTVDEFRWAADHPDRANLAGLFGVLAMPFLFGTALVYMLLSRRRSPRLAYAGGILLGLGFVGLTAVTGGGTALRFLAQDGRFDLNTLADAADKASTPPAIAIFLLFLPGAFFGLLTMAAALWRSRAVPRGAILLIPVFIVTDFFLQMGIVGHAIWFVEASWIAWAVVATKREESAER